MSYRDYDRMEGTIMNTELMIHEISLGFSRDKQMLVSFLAKHHLNYEEDIEAAFGVFDSDETLYGCGCCAGNLLKCFAVDETLRGQNVLGSLVSQLVENRFRNGHYDLFVITRPKNRSLFTSCGFYPLAETESVLMLENKKNGPERFYKQMIPEGIGAAPNSRNGGIGCIVMNCNPFTKGHLALIEFAAARCDLLHIFVVEENRSAFPFDVRIRLVREGTAHLSNVLVHPSGPYMISSATFPTYFLKEGEDAAEIQSALDITLFASRIAPIFGITKRFVGEEPFDPVSKKYNEAMINILHDYGITFMRIDRVVSTSPSGITEVISASRVRRLLVEQGVTEEVLSLVPDVTADYLKYEFKGF